jgi:diguanylate cyclase (GGDEF)-like protein
MIIMDLDERMTKKQLLAEIVRLRRRIAHLETRLAECQETEQNCEHLATHDGLTGLYNRIFFEDEMSRLERGRQFPISIIAADVDGLMQINDRHGHAAGDDQLKRTASVLKEAFRADEIVARIGGDEFAVLLPKTDEATARAALDRVGNKLLSHNAAQAGTRLRFSLGAATAKVSGSLLEALRQADAQMLQEKTAHQLEDLNSMPREPHLVFQHVDARLSANPGIHLSRLASELACERHLIERSVKAVTSMPFREYRQVRLLTTALQLLGKKPLLIKQISSVLGYASPKSLWRLLRTKTGQSPSNLRALMIQTPAANSREGMLFPTYASPERLK